MKTTLLFIAISSVLASPTLMAKSELETLRALCKEQERQIHQLENDNSQLRSLDRESRSTIAKTATVSTTQPKAEPTKASATPSTAQVAPAQTTAYTVKAGDSFGKIARKVGTTPEKLAKTNGLKMSAVIRPGQKLKVPGAPALASSHVTAPAVTKPTPVTAKSHKVQAGETFSSISKKHKITTADLISANPKVNPTTLRPGQVISLGGEAAPMTMISNSTAPAANQTAAVPTNKVPAPVPNNIPVSTPAPPKPFASAEPKSQPAAAPAPTPAPVAENPAPAATNAPDRKVHPVIVENELTYGEFASKHGTDTERLNALNGLDLINATVLAKGSELYVPAQP